MSATATLDSGQAGRDWMGGRFVRRGTLNLGTYASGGVAVDRTTFSLDHSLVDLDVKSASGYIARWDKPTAKVMVYDQKDPAASGGADIALPEVGAVDLSAVLFRFTAIGK